MLCAVSTLSAGTDEELHELLGRQGLRKDVTLQLVALELPEQAALLLGLDAFCNDFQLERMRERDDSRYDREGVGIVGHRHHERAVDFKCVYGQPGKVAQRRIPGAEIVYRYLDAH